VRTALDATVLATQEGVLDATMLGFDRDRDARGRVRRDSSITESVRVREPYVTRPPAELVESGFARLEAPGELALFVPDARVLLDARFLATHCYGLRDERPPQPGWVGLTFAPAAPRNVPDVEGTLWVEEATAELRALEFRYIGLPEPWASLVGPLAQAGGEVRFARLPSGLWVVRAWHVRLPVPAARPVDPLASTRRYAVERVWENGGELLDARRVDANAPITAMAGNTRVRVTIAATVRVVDEGGAPVPDAEVAVDTGATLQAARTDGEGVVQLPALAAGERRLAVRAVGFTPVDTVYTIPPEPDLTVTVAIGRVPAPGAQQLPVTRIVERRATALEGFERRRRAGLGVYLTSEDLEKRKVRRVTDAFVGIPGMQVSSGIVSMPRPGFGGTRALTEPCLVTVFVDGTRAQGIASPVQANANGVLVADVAGGPTGNAELGGAGYQSPFLGVQPSDVAAIEVYRGLGVTPPEFAGMGSACGTIVVWTKRGLKTERTRP
jgi:hypothetical protein